MKSLHAAIAIAAVLSALALAATLRGQTIPPVFLNHFFVVVDAVSYRALQESSYMTGAFAPFEIRTTARNDQTYTGAYWYGRRTYFEAFEPDAQGPLGASGLAFGVDGKGESAVVKAAWAAAFGGADSGTVTRKTENGEPAWFQMTYAKAQAGLRVWLMEYDLDFLARWYPRPDQGARHHAARGPRPLRGEDRPTGGSRQGSLQGRHRPHARPGGGGSGRPRQASPGRGLDLARGGGGAGAPRP